MKKRLKFYDYEKCFEHYAQRIVDIKQAKINGEVIVAKPVFLLSLIDGIEEGVFFANHFVLNDWLEERYLLLMKKYTQHSQFPSPTDINNPFWHLSTDGFWHLGYQGEPLGKSSTPSKAWLKENVKHAWLDVDLWLLLQQEEWCQRLRDFIVEHKLSNPEK